MGEGGIETGVDRLVQFLEGKGKQSLKDVSSAIKVPESTLQLWIEFLVEEQVIGIEYKFTKPYIFLNTATTTSTLVEDTPDSKISLKIFKSEFFENAKNKMIPDSKIPLLWGKHLETALKKQSEYFIREAAKRQLPTPEKLFEKYKGKLFAV